VKSHPVPQRAGQFHINLGLIHEARWPLLDQCYPGTWLICANHEITPAGFKILHSLNSAQEGEREHSLYEQLKSKINEAKRVSKNSVAPEEAACIMQPAVLSSLPTSGISESGWEDVFKVFTPEEINHCPQSSDKPELLAK
jgi:hypothetical protein